ncbi:hypothetical protein E4U21_005510 [Claviceps maximensis]|nr:hypothetical protein E4U21_005510 [Claviceps maximensis]
MKYLSLLVAAAALASASPSGNLDKRLSFNVYCRPGKITGNGTCEKYGLTTYCCRGKSTGAYTSVKTAVLQPGIGDNSCDNYAGSLYCC